jgi:hypothetical protein
MSDNALPLQEAQRLYVYIQEPWEGLMQIQLLQDRHYFPCNMHTLAHSDISPFSPLFLSRLLQPVRENKLGIGTVGPSESRDGTHISRSWKKVAGKKVVVM